MTTIRIADYARSPGGRFISDGPFSGEWFREEILRPALAAAIDAGQKLNVEMDGTSGYGSSFLEEAFGGLIRKRLFPASVVYRSLVFVAKRPLYAPYKALAERYVLGAKPEAVSVAA